MNKYFLLHRPGHSRLYSGFVVLALILAAGAVNSLSAQSGSGAAANEPATAAATTDAGKEPTQAKPAPQTATPVGEGFRFGAYQGRSEFEVGYRWSPGIKGNDQMYRSQVNLFQGVRLFRSYLTLRSEPGTGLFDRMDVSLNSVGDPYGTFRFNMSRMDLYDFRASYRDLNYYNFISSFANPLLASGNLFAQHNLDVNYRMSDFDLRLFPNRRFVPFVGYSRNSASGPGFSTTEFTGNEFLVRTDWKYSSDHYRAGLQFNLPSLSVTVEQGYQYLKNDSRITDFGQPQGNESRPFLGQVISLDSLNRGYHGRVKLPSSRVLAKFSPFDNLHLAGRYIYSIGSTDSNQSEIRMGNFVDLGEFLNYTAAADGFNGRAKRPNHNGAFVVEFSPFSRITLTDNVDFLKYHVSGAAVLSTLFFDAGSLQGPGPRGDASVENLLNTRFVYDEIRNQVDAQVDLGAGLAVRAGHRYSFLEVTNDDAEDVTTSELSRNTGIVGLVYRPGKWLRVGLDYENTQTNQPITRTDLLDYDQWKIDWRIGGWKGLSFDGRIGLLSNEDEAPDIQFESRDRSYAFGLNYNPNERISLGADFTRTNFLSDLLIVLPQNLTTTNSIFRERVSGFGGRLGLGVYKGIKTEIGYRGVINRGSYPLEFHQPYLSFWVPLGRNLALKPTWQYFGYSQDLFGFENYQTHLLTFGLVYTR